MNNIPISNLEKKIINIYTPIDGFIRLFIDRNPFLPPCLRASVKAGITYDEALHKAEERNIKTYTKLLNYYQEEGAIPRRLSTKYKETAGGRIQLTVAKYRNLISRVSG